MFIAVAGNVGSGKTQTAKVISKGFGWEYLPQNRPELKYLNDLFTNPSRWSFETQVSFLVSKADNVRWGFDRGRSIVLDRSIYEDADIFARLFILQQNLDKRAYRTYSQIAQYLIESLPTPNLIIYCNCSPEICRERIFGRGLKPHEKSYPEEHIHELSELYTEWVRTFSDCPVFSLDTEQYDLRDEAIASKFLEDIQKVLREGTEESQYQLSLFAPNWEQGHEESLNLLLRLNDVPLLPAGEVPVVPSRSRRTPTTEKRVYIAAPFSQKAESSPSLTKARQQTILAGYEPPHGIIAPGAYRKSLTRIATTFRRLGLYPHLPHRDTNKWGRKVLAATTVVQKCQKEVTEADLFFGIFGISTGVHFEAGIAAGLKKPIIVAKVANMEESFFADGIAQLPNSIVIAVDSIAEIPEHLTSYRVREFLRQYNLL